MKDYNDSLLKLDTSQIIQKLGMSDLSLVLYVLKKKYGSHFKFIDIGNDCMIRIAGQNVANVSYLPVYLHFLKISNSKLHLTGTTAIPKIMYGKCEFYVCVNGHDQRPAFRECFLNESISGEDYEIRRVFDYDVDLREMTNVEIQFVMVTKGIRSVLGKINSMRFCPVADVHPHQYYYADDFCVSIDKSTIKVEKGGKELQKKFEGEYTTFIKSQLGDDADRVISLRKAYFDYHKSPKRKKWLFFDRIDKADDNAEAFFLYCTSRSIQIDADLYFVLSNKTPDFARLKQYGNVIAALSYEHGRLFLQAEYIITSQLNGYVENPFGEYEEYFRDIYHRPQVVFLQHGVTKDDQTKWLGNFNQELFSIITSSRAESDAFLNNKKYFLNDRQVWLTGMPRLDLLMMDKKNVINLNDDCRKYILIMPTWRKEYMEQIYDQKKMVYEWHFKKDFHDSHYYKYYHELLNDNNLSEVCNRYGYRLIFMPHPIVQPYIMEFNPGDHVLLFDYNTTDWRELFKKSDLMITDYSSVAFDFAYMRKPIIYYQFDKKEFYDKHSYSQGYFDYKKMGFGEVVTNYNDLLKSITTCLSSKCTLKRKYKDRINKFFEYTDANNCYRLLQRLSPSSNLGYHYKSDNDEYSFKIIGGHIVHIEYSVSGKEIQTWNIYLENVFWGGIISFPMTVEAGAVNRILWVHKLSPEEFEKTGEYAAKGYADGYICVFSKNDDEKLYFVLYTTLRQLYRNFIFFDHKNESVCFKNDTLKLEFEGCLYSDKYKDLEVTKAALVINRFHTYPIKLELQEKKDNYVGYCVDVTVESIVSNETDINNSIYLEIELNDNIRINFGIGESGENEQQKKFYYLPVASCYYNEHVLFVRKNVNQNYTLVVRQAEDIEKTEWFRDVESAQNSKKMYLEGIEKRKLHTKPVNLFFEKDSMKADEGVWELFIRSCEEHTSDNYFILDKRSPAYETLSKHKNVVAKYSHDYYNLLYSADNMISTETSSHLNVHRSANYYVRRTILEKRLIFLQHGITYMKCQGASSVFGKDKEGEPSLIAVSSKKEADAISDMLKIPIERCMITGLPVFSVIEYEHINDENEDNIAVMLTWKPYEERMLEHFEYSSYYYNLKNILALLKEKVSEDKIFLVPHPKVYDHLMSTDLSDKVWKGAISDILKKAKLLITDYSSTCYNSFYQGAGVVFYQPDLEKYEKHVGRLIPQDNEYIGYRATSMVEMKLILDSGIKDRHIDLDYFRTEEFKKRYKDINNFSDGKNIDRIFQFLKQQEII